MKTGTQDCEYLKWQTCPLVECECMPLKYVDDADIPSVTVKTETDDTPTLSRDMTPEEKGALLLAHHEGRVIEAFVDETWMRVAKQPLWSDELAYRIKPQLKVETVTIYTGNLHGEWGPWNDEDDTHSITFTVTDGKVDPVAQVEEL